MLSSLLRPQLRRLPGGARALHHAPALSGDWSSSAAEQIHAKGSAAGIKYYLFNFVDLFGVARSKMVPAEAIKDVAAGGAGFAGFAAWLDMTPAYADVLCLPDPDSFTQLPWKKDVAWLACNPMIDGAEVAQAPRNVLRAQNRELRAKAMHLITGVETEWHVLDPNEHAMADKKDTQAKPCYDQNGLMRQYDYITELIDCVSELGWGPYQCDHEDSCGQFELNWEPTDALVTADRHGFFKYMAAALAEKHNLRATFMPKPFLEHTGNGCHVHHSLWHDDGTAAFEDETGQFGLSSTAMHWLGGLLAHAPAAAAITNPTVNSYKRINAPTTSSGATWAPNTVSWTGNNRTHMIRVPSAPRFELRVADGATNPYLLQASMIAAGLDGIEKTIEPPPACDENMYSAEPSALAAAATMERLPLYMLDAIRQLEADSVLRERLDVQSRDGSGKGKAFSDSYLHLKFNQWDAYCHHLSSWELENTLDC